MVTSTDATGGGSVSTSSAITINNFPFWVTVGGGLSGTSTLSFIGTQLLQNADFNASGTITQNGVAVLTTSTGLTVNNFVSTGISQWGNSPGYLANGSTTATSPITWSVGNVIGWNNSTNYVAAGSSTLWTASNVFNSLASATGTSATSTIGMNTGNFSTISITTCNGCPAGANPTATIDVTAVNGVATTFMRSDGAPALNTKYASSSVTLNIYDATTTAPYRYAKWRTEISRTITEISCDEYASATSTFEIYRATGLGSEANASMILGSISCGISGTTSNTFTTSTLNAGDFLFANATGTFGGTPTWTAINVYFRK